MDRNLSEILCASEIIPSIPDYLSGINVYGIWLLTSATAAVILVLGTFIDTLSYTLCHSSPRAKAHTACITAVYPVVALATYFAILVPRAHLLAEALTQGVFMAAMYQLFCLFVAYCGGEAELVRKVRPGTLSLQVFPCCCWPCCSFLPAIEITKNTIRRLRLLVVQLPIVQGLVYLVLLVMWAERESLYQVNYMYVQPLIIASILMGIWGMAMTINVLKRFIGDDFLMPQKFIVLQLVLLFAKFQGLLTRSLVWTSVLPCRPPITPAVYGNLIYNIFMLSEMVILAWWARKLYRRQLPAIDSLLPSITTIGAIMASGRLKENNNEACRTLNVHLQKKLEGGHINTAINIDE